MSILSQINFHGNGKESTFILAWVLFLSLLHDAAWSQGKIEQEKIVSMAYDAANPHEVLGLLDEVPTTETLSDSSRSKYYLAKAIAFGKLGEADSSLYYTNRCIAFARSNGNDFFTLRAFNVEGIIWRMQGKHEESLLAFQNAERILEQSKDESLEKSRSTLLGNLGGIYFQLEDFKNAKDYSKNAMKSAQAFGDSTSIAFSYLRLAIIAEEEDSLDLSLQYNQAAQVYFELLEDYSSLTYVQNNLGGVYLKKSEYGKAIVAFEKAMDYARRSEDIETYTHTLIAKAEAHYSLSQLSIAQALVEEAISIADEKGYAVHSKNAHDLRYKIYKLKGDFNRALADKELSATISDSLNSTETRERIADLELKYESAKQEAEIIRLESEKSLALLEAEQSLQLTILSIAASVLLFVFLIIFYGLRLKKSRAERQVKEQQYDALQKRYIELLKGPQTFALTSDLDSLNSKVVNPLTEREFEALSLGLKGKSNKEIADELFVSESTVKFHLRNVYNKLGVANRKEALEYVVKTS